MMQFLVKAWQLFKPSVKKGPRAFRDFEKLKIHAHIRICK